MHDVANSFKMKGFNISDDPLDIKKYEKFFFKEPILLNINTNRLFWHSGAGIDSDKIFDRYENLKKKLGKPSKVYDKKINTKIKKKWEQILERL